MRSTSAASLGAQTRSAVVVDERPPEWGDQVWTHPEIPGPDGGYPAPLPPAGGNPGPSGEDGEDGAEPPGDGGGPVGSHGTGPSPIVVPADGVTRQLCAAIHLSAAFASRVHDELVEPGFQGVAPNWNLDTIALARHAEQAIARRAERDRKLLVEFVVVVIVIAVTSELVALGVFGPVGVGPVVLICVVVALLVYGVAFVIVWSHYSAVHRSAVAVVGGPGVQALEPPPLPAEVEQALDEAAHANVVLFSGQTPFVGSGTLLDHWVISVDISTGSTGADGERAVPERFDSLDLHEALLVALSGSISPPPASGLRLYVVGGHALAVGGMFRAGPVPSDETSAIRFRRPVSTVPAATVKDYVRRPAASARPYTYFELSGWDGQVVVTLFVRVVVNHPTLFVETSVCALRPPRAEYGDVGTIPLGPGVHRLPVLRTVLPMVIPLLLDSPATPFNNLRDGHRQKVARRKVALVLARRGDVNFAAGPSLREAIASGGNGNHFGFIDEQMYYRMFNRRALDCLRDYLTTRNVDVAEFDKQQTVILEKTITNAQNIYGHSADDA